MYKKILFVLFFVGCMVTSIIAQDVNNIQVPVKPSKPAPNRPARPANNSNVITIKVGDVSFEMIKVEAGYFVMGCTEEQEESCADDENPYHKVTISKNYYIGKFEVTQELYEAVMGENPSKWKFFDRPVENVSWEEAQEFCNKLSRMTGRKFSLPTEAEWEYAARGGKKSSNTIYCGSPEIDDVAWYDDNSDEHTHAVGKLSPNELGIYDMSGNVWEWCLDWYGDYSSSSQTDPKGPETGSKRVLRGGSWIYNDWSCRVTYRASGVPTGRGSSVGFRVVLH